MKAKKNTLCKVRQEVELKLNVRSFKYIHVAGLRDFYLKGIKR